MARVLVIRPDELSPAGLIAEVQLPSAMQFGTSVGAAWAALVNRAAGKAASGPDDQHNRPAKV